MFTLDFMCGLEIIVSGVRSQCKSESVWKVNFIDEETNVC